jgi:hypothetical protein
MRKRPWFLKGRRHPEWERVLSVDIHSVSIAWDKDGEPNDTPDTEGG